jgi:hypothetical protein
VTHPGQPCAAVCAKGQRPGGLEGLEELVGLEEGAQGEGVEQAEGQHQGQQHVAVAGHGGRSMAVGEAGLLSKRTR